MLWEMVSKALLKSGQVSPTVLPSPAKLEESLEKARRRISHDFPSVYPYLLLPVTFFCFTCLEMVSRVTCITFTGRERRLTGLYPPP